MIRDNVTILLVLAVSAASYYLPLGLGLDAEAQLGLAVLVFSGGLWVLAPIPLQVTSLLIPVALIVTQVLPPAEAFSSFASPVVFLILGSLFMAEALRKHGLTRRLAMLIILQCKGRPKILLLALMVVAALTSMWVFSTAVVAMLIPVCLAISSQVDSSHRDQFVNVLLMALVLSTTLGALSTILGASSNAIASGSLADVQAWSFFDWMKYGTPLAALFVPLSWLIMVGFAFPDVDQLDVRQFENEIQTRESMSGKEKGILWILGGAIVFWVLGPPLASWIGLDPTLVDSAVISMAAAGLLFMGNIITWGDARQVNWGVYLIIGAGLSLGKGLHASGLSGMIGDLVSAEVQNWPYPLTAGMLILGSALISNVVNNTTVVAILAPIMADAAIGMGFAPPELMLPMAFGATFGFIVPSASSRTALVYTSGEISQTFMMKTGVLVTIPLIFLTVSYFWILSGLGWL